MKLTLVVKKGKSGFLIGQLKELPAVFAQVLRDVPRRYKRTISPRW